VNNLSYENSYPYYHQLYTILRDEITCGRWKPGELPPPETELIEQFRISRIAIRQAPEILVEEGLINCRRRRGTFLTERHIEQSINKIIDFTADKRHRRQHPETEVISASILLVPGKIAEKLQIPVEFLQLHLAVIATSSLRDSVDNQADKQVDFHFVRNQLSNQKLIE
jgi:GntR family transcriptional regulator